MEYNSDIICLLEPRVTYKNANTVTDKLGFFKSHRIEIVGFSRRIWVGWKDSIRVQIIQNHPNLSSSKFMVMLIPTIFLFPLSMVVQTGTSVNFFGKH